MSSIEVSQELKTLINTYGFATLDRAYQDVRRVALEEYATVLRAAGYSVFQQQQSIATAKEVTISKASHTNTPVYVEEQQQQLKEVTVAQQERPKRGRKPKVRAVAPPVPMPEPEPEPASTPAAEQRRREKEKAAELRAAGVDPGTVLTIENVQAWVNEGRSYAWIAREKVGCKQELVSTFVRLNNIKRQVV
jgi:hypothetical protein